VFSVQFVAVVSGQSQFAVAVVSPGGQSQFAGKQRVRVFPTTGNADAGKGGKSMEIGRMKNEGRKTKDERRKTKNEIRRTKYEKRKTKNERRNKELKHNPFAQLKANSQKPEARSQ